jgi:hypothetical protein
VDPLVTFRTRFSCILDPLKYTRSIMAVYQVYFTGPKLKKFLALKGKNFHYVGPLKHIRFFKVRKKNLMYFIAPKFG